MSWDFEREQADVIVGCFPLICLSQLVVLSSATYSELSDRKAASIRYFDWREALWFSDLSDMFVGEADHSSNTTDSAASNQT